MSTPRIIPREEHTVSRSAISENALKVLYRLKNSGYQAYLVGGCVRDLLLGREPKDFDVATDAHPEEIKDLFRNCRLVGRRFRLAHVRFGREIIEVATFRAQHSGDAEGGLIEEDGRIIQDNVFGTVEEDALRRDFTVNALYYDIRDFSIVDYANGLEDLKAGRLRLIGDPETRYREDPVRMLRAVRFASKLGFRIEEESEARIWALGHLLRDIAPARLFDEMLKLFLGGYGLQTFENLRHYDLFGHLFPATEQSLAVEEGGYPHQLLTCALANTDARLAEDKPVIPGFLTAALLWEPLRERVAQLQVHTNKPALAIMYEAAEDIMREQSAHIAIPRRFGLQAREIWDLQLRLERTQGRRPLLLLEHPRFRAGYDFMLLRRQAGEDLGELCEWWTRIQEADAEERSLMAQVKGEGSGGKSGGDAKRKRRRRPRKRRPARAHEDSAVDPSQETGADSAG
ncbi:MAG: polynucleotide adenylyltransferase PcnB [Gammaproteobacteria bacterium]|nr:polynucleotide adenylyltransferase PcnB [Gammaproteobacteria bacterium]